MSEYYEKTDIQRRYDRIYFIREYIFPIVVVSIGIGIIICIGLYSF